MENNLNAKIHEKINGWMNKLDHFELQVSLGKMEAKDEYQKQKKELHSFLHEYIQSAEQFKDVAKEKVDLIKKSLIDLKNEFQKDEEISEKSIKKHKEAIGSLLNNVNDKLQ